MIVGVDPHKASHTATAVDASNTKVGSMPPVAAIGSGCARQANSVSVGRRLGNAPGLGSHLFQCLAAQDKTVLDASTAATASVASAPRRRCGSG